MRRNAQQKGRRTGFGIIVAIGCTLAVASCGTGTQTQMTETSTAAPVAPSVTTPPPDSVPVPAKGSLPLISIDIARLGDFASPVACTMQIPNDIPIGEVSQIPDSVLLKAIVPTYDPGSGTALVRSNRIDACNGAAAYANIEEAEKSNACPAAGEMGALCNPVRFRLKDGRLAVWVYTSISSYSSGTEQSGLLAIVALRDKKVVVEGVSRWRNGDNTPRKLQQRKLGGHTVYVEEADRGRGDGGNPHGENVWMLMGDQLRQVLQWQTNYLDTTYQRDYTRKEYKRVTPQWAADTLTRTTEEKYQCVRNDKVVDEVRWSYVETYVVDAEQKRLRVSSSTEEDAMKSRAARTVKTDARPESEVREYWRFVCAADRVGFEKGFFGATPDGKVSHINIKKNPRYATNNRFGGDVWLLMDTTDKAPEGFPPERRAEMKRATRLFGGDRFYVHGGFCKTEAGELSIGGVISFKTGETVYGEETGECSGRVVSLGPDFEEVDAVQRHPVHGASLNYQYEFHKPTGAHRLTFAHGRVDIVYHKPGCMDSDVHKVVVHDKKGGRITLHNFLTTGVLLFDEDGDGQDEIFLVSTLACERAIKVVKVVMPLVDNLRILNG